MLSLSRRRAGATPLQVIPLSSSSEKEDDSPPDAVFANARQLLAAAPSFTSKMDASHEKIDA